MSLKINFLTRNDICVSWLALIINIITIFVIINNNNIENCSTRESCDRPIDVGSCVAPSMHSHGVSIVALNVGISSGTNEASVGSHGNVGSGHRVWKAMFLSSLVAKGSKGTVALALSCLGGHWVVPSIRVEVVLVVLVFFGLLSLIR